MKKKLPLLMTLVMTAILIALGSWQLYRLQWKTALLENINRQMAAASVPLPQKIETPKEWEYRRVSVSGYLLSNRKFLLKPRTEGGRNGYHVFMPLKRVNGGSVFVNCGFADDASLKKFTCPVNHSRVEGIVRLPQKTFFTPANNPAKNDWYWPDLSAMAAAAHLKKVSPVIVSLIPGAPDIPNKHLQYAFFWFSMAFILLAIYTIYRRKGVRK